VVVAAGVVIVADAAAVAEADEANTDLGDVVR